MLYKFLIYFILFCFITSSLSAQVSSSDGVLLNNPDEMHIYLDDSLKDDAIEIQTDSSHSNRDDLEEFKNDFKDIEYVKSDKKDNNWQSNLASDEEILLGLSSKLEKKISRKEWKKTLRTTKAQTYKVQEGDDLMSISKKFFGTEDYASKIWSLNPKITNPHELTPGMIIVFNNGSKAFPQMDVVSKKRKLAIKKANKNKTNHKAKEIAYSSSWLNERKKLLEEGIEINSVTDYTVQDLLSMDKELVNKEYKKYYPTSPLIELKPTSDDFDKFGIDKNLIVRNTFKLNNFLNTFMSKNPINELGKIDSAIKTGMILSLGDTVYLNLNNPNVYSENQNLSVYQTTSEVSKPDYFERQGNQYDVVATLKLVKKIKNLWEAKIIEYSGIVMRGDKVTNYYPKIEEVRPFLSDRQIEGRLIGSYQAGKMYATLGDIVYLNRGKSDGVQAGHVFNVMNQVDRSDKKNILNQPVYSSGEITILNVNDDFATAIVSSQKRDFQIGDFVKTKDKIDYAKSQNLSDASAELNKVKNDKLDMEIDFKSLNDDILQSAKNTKLSEDELAELERQEKTRSFMEENKADNDLVSIEKEIEESEKLLNQEKESVVSTSDTSSDGALSAKNELDQMEVKYGKKYLDQELNDKENPYGLTDYDIEEVDELLNLSQKPKDNPDEKDSLKLQ